MADAQDLKSWGLKKPCGFESHHRHALPVTWPDTLRTGRGQGEVARSLKIFPSPPFRLEERGRGEEAFQNFCALRTYL